MILNTVLTGMEIGVAVLLGIAYVSVGLSIAGAVCQEKDGWKWVWVVPLWPLVVLVFGFLMLSIMTASSRGE